jgi:gliding motility-associated-like protein
MKRALVTINLLLSVFGFSQAISVNTTTYNVPQLVTDVLVNKPCVIVNNITSSTGTNFGSTNGIGYFTNTNPAFPLQSGVILSTGNVLNAQGPNSSQLNDGATTWPGDANLEATLLASGITMSSTNATVLEFDFTPFSPNFNFQFLFASEEYGNFQCQFSDAFAFLLTDKTSGVTSNLAIVPGSTLPISVVTIRDFLYNSSCPSVNSEYFGAFNGGSLASTSATNFNGQTKILNATATLIPNRQYHIKLVIADRQDSSADSAIFLGANSFNIGQDVLGQDLTVANNNAICDGQNYTINSGLDPTIYSFAWTFNGNPVGGNTPNLSITQPGTYGLTYTIKSSNCTVTTDFLTVEYYSPINTANPVNLYNCNSGQTTYTFDLSYNTPIISTAGLQVSYHSSQANAMANSNALPLSYTVSSTNIPTTVWSRILNPSTGCYTTKSFQLLLTPAPIANNPGNYSLCEDVMGGGTANFNLSTKNSPILGGQSPNIYTVSYYVSHADANGGLNPIDTSVLYSSGNKTIFARVQNNTDATCFNLISFNLIVVPAPVIPDPADQFVCTSYILPTLSLGNYYTGPNGTGTMLQAGDVITTDSTIYIYYATATTPSCKSETSFTVTIVDELKITPKSGTFCDQYVLPKLFPGAKYFTAAGGSSNPSNTELFAGDVITKDGQMVYVTFISLETPACLLEKSFIINIDITPVITDTFQNVFDCTSYSLPKLKVGDYYTLDSTTGVYTPAISPITETTTLYVFATNNKCKTTDKVFTVYIGTLGIANVVECLSYTLPTLPLGEYRDAANGAGNTIPAGTIITKNTTIYTYVPGASCTNDDFFTITIQGPFLSTPIPVTVCASYTLPVQPELAQYFTLSGGPATAGNIELFPNTSNITTTSTVYVYKGSSVVGCYNEKPWLITINQKPVIDSRPDIEQCNYYDLTPLNNGNYYDNPNGVNPLPAGTRITKNNTIYIFSAHSNDALCYSQNSFNVTINGTEAAPAPTQLIHCDRFVLPVLPANNFYYTQSGGPNTVGNILLSTVAERTVTATTTFYIFTQTNNRLNCSDEKTFTITINKTPVANNPHHFTECDTFGANDGIFSFNLRNAETDVLGTQTPATDFVFTYYTSLADANNPLATPIANPEAYQNDTPFKDSVWIRISNNIPAFACFSVTRLDLYINLLPEPILATEYFICEDYETGLLKNPVLLNPMINGSNYTFEWRKDMEPTILSTDPTYIAKEIGKYVVTVYDSKTKCQNTVGTNVKSYKPFIEVVYSDAFEQRTYLTVHVNGAGSGNYKYRVDNSNYQEDNVFYNIDAGEHTVYVRDESHICSPEPMKIEFINYPQYFTPNGDGYNETWNLHHLKSTNPNASISIFDRLGKLIKQITPSTEGWNGTFNNEQLPATDYWFIVDYVEKGENKTFKSHFALKR